MNSNNEIEFIYHFKERKYLIYILCDAKKFTFTLEDFNETHYWNGSWDADEIEEITIKAKSHKTYQVFTKMILSALNKDSGIVKLDLLDFTDLLNLKKIQDKSTADYYKFHDPEEDILNETDVEKVKTRYLIIKYSTDFEQTKFPLRLDYIEKPSEVYTIRTINRLRLNDRKYDNVDIGSKMEIEDLKAELTNLKGKIKLLESLRQNGAVDNEEYLKSISNLKDDFAAYKSQAESKIKKQIKYIEDLKERMKEQSNTLHAQIKKIEEESKIVITDLEKKNQSLSDLIVSNKNKFKKMMAEHKEDFISLVKEIQSQTEFQKRLQNKITKQEKELDLNDKLIQRLQAGGAGESGKRLLGKKVKKRIDHSSDFSNKSTDRTGVTASGITNLSSNTAKYQNVKKETNRSTEKKSHHSKSSTKFSTNKSLSRTAATAATNIPIVKKTRRDLSEEQEDEEYYRKLGKAKGKDFEEITRRENPFDKEIDLSNLRVSASKKFGDYDISNNILPQDTYYRTRDRSAAGRDKKSVVSEISTSTYHAKLMTSVPSSGYGKNLPSARIVVLSNSKSRSKSKDISRDSSPDIKPKKSGKEKVTAEEYFKNCDHGEDIEGGLARVAIMMNKSKKK